VKFLLDHDVPDDLSYLLEQLGHDITLLRKARPRESSDETVFRFAQEAGCILLTCNRDDFLRLAAAEPHEGIVVIVRRRTRGEERVALFRLLDRAGSTLSIASPDQMSEIAGPGLTSQFAQCLLLGWFLRRRGRHRNFECRRPIFLAIEIVDGLVNEGAMANISWEAL